MTSLIYPLVPRQNLFIFVRQRRIFFLNYISVSQEYASPRITRPAGLMVLGYDVDR